LHGVSFALEGSDDAGITSSNSIFSSEGLDCRSMHRIQVLPLCASTRGACYITRIVNRTPRISTFDQTIKHTSSCRAKPSLRPSTTSRNVGAARSPAGKADPGARTYCDRVSTRCGSCAVAPCTMIGCVRPNARTSPRGLNRWLLGRRHRDRRAYVRRRGAAAKLLPSFDFEPALGGYDEQHRQPKLQG
jgi:hypothetical protein